MSTADIQLSVVFGGQYSFEKLQSDYEQTDTLARDYIKNKPDLVNFEAETVTAETVIFDENPTGELGALNLQYSPDEKTLEFGLADGGKLQIGKEMFEEYTNIDTVPLTNGMIVSTAAIPGNRKGIKRTDFTSLTSIRSIVGMVTVASIATNQAGRVTTKGIINDLNTNGWAEGSQLWGNPSVLGGWSGSKPAKPQYAVQIGQVVVASATVGSVELNVAKDVKFSDLADVNGATTLIDNADTIPKRDADGIIREITVADIKADFKTDTDALYEPLLGFTPENTANKGQANGYASLGADGLVPSNQLPSYVDDVLEFNTLADFPAVGETGKIYVAKDTNKQYRWGGSTYVYITSGAVDSVAGKTGVVSLVKADVGLGNVDNTSDANKPVSTLQQNALDLKIDKTLSSEITTVGDSETMAVKASDNIWKRITWSNIKATLKTYFETLFVTLTGAQNVAGVKTFTDSPVVPTPVNDTDAANKAYVDTIAVTQSNLESARSQSTTKAPTSKFFEDELSEILNVTGSTTTHLLYPDGSTITSGNWQLTDKIPFNAGEGFFIHATALPDAPYVAVLVFDLNDIVIDEFYFTDSRLTNVYYVPQNCKIRAGARKLAGDVFVVKKYIPLGLKISSNETEINNLSLEINNLSLEVNNLTSNDYLNKVKTLFPLPFVGYINSSGAYIPNINWNTTDFIDLEYLDLQKIYATYSYGLAVLNASAINFYNEFKVWQSAESLVYKEDGVFVGREILRPNNLRYVRITSDSSYANTEVYSLVEQLKLSFIESGNDNRFYNKSVVNCGDSITWYDKNTLAGNSGGGTGGGAVCIGYIQIISKKIGFSSYVNLGNSGRSMSGNDGLQDYQNIAAYDYSTKNLVTIAHGTNDFKLNRSIGVIGSISDTVFDNSTFYGAYRTALDAIIASNQNIEIVLLTPIQRNHSGYTIEYTNSAGHKLIDYVNAIKSIGQLYSLKVIDLYSNSGINFKNVFSFTIDGLHPNNAGHSKIAECIIKSI